MQYKEYHSDCPNDYQMGNEPADLEGDRLYTGKRPGLWSDSGCDGGRFCIWSNNAVYQRDAIRAENTNEKNLLSLPSWKKPQNKTASCAPLAKITAIRKNRHPATTVMWEWAYIYAHSQRNEALLRIFWTADYTERYAATNKTYQRSESEEWDAHTVERFHDGFYYKFHLPSDAVLSGGQIIYTRFQITICGLGESKNNSTNSFHITLKYAHTRLRISSDLSFSWSTGGKYPGVTFSLAPSIGTTYYGLPCKVS